MTSLKPLRSIRMNDELYLKLKEVASKDKRSFNNMVELILQKYVDDYEQQHGEIKVDTDALYE